MAAHTPLDTLIRPVFENLLLEVHGLLQRSEDSPRDQQPGDNTPLLPQSPPIPLPPSSTGSSSTQVKNKPNLAGKNNVDKLPKSIIAHLTTITTQLTLPTNLMAHNFATLQNTTHLINFLPRYLISLWRV